MGLWARGRERRNVEQDKTKRKGFKENTWMSRPCHSPSSNAGEAPSSIQTQAQSNTICSWVEDSGSSASSFSLEVSSNKQRVSNNKDQKGAVLTCLLKDRIYSYRECPYLEVLVPLHLTSLLFPPWALPLPSLSPPVSFTSVPAVYPMKERNSLLLD